jgi:hypothetical protein
MTIHQNTRRASMTKIVRASAFALLLTATASCDTDVVNPGPVEDEFVKNRNAATALVNGSGRALATGVNWISYTGAAVTREVHPAGATGSFGITNSWQKGQLNSADADLNVHWEQAQRARWLAEESARRLEDVGPPVVGVDIQTPAAYVNALRQAYVYAGYANRLLGENMCDAVIDGSAVLGSGTLGTSVYFTRAESLFTKALALAGGTPATTLRLDSASRAGRASVRMYRGDWTNAIVDAATLAPGFSYTLAYFSVGEDAQRNRIFYASGHTRESSSAYRAHTQWNTWHLQYRYGGNGAQLTAAMIAAPAIVDPRISIIIGATPTGDAALDCCGIVPFWPQAKYTSSASAVRLSSGREMLLIRAEERLRANDLATAMTHLNAARTNAGAATITATDITDGWRLLKRERGIELWLEARRMGDRRRWVEGSTPGTLEALELPNGPYPGPLSPSSHLDPAVHPVNVARTFCFPVSRSEQDTNPNI